MNTYNVKVRESTYLWGGQGVVQSFSTDLYIFLRVDDHGEAITIGHEKLNPRRQTLIAELQPGETLTVPLSNLSGIYAHCKHDCQVQCAIQTSSQ